MPGFAPRLTDVEIWNLIQSLDAQSAARNADTMSERVKPLRADSRAGLQLRTRRPFAGIAAESRDDRVTLLVLYTLPQSLPRLGDIATRHRAYAADGGAHDRGADGGIVAVARRRRCRGRRIYPC